MITHNEYYEDVIKLFETLNQNKILIPFNDDLIFDKIFTRNNSTMHISEMKYMIITDPELFKKYKKFWSSFDVNEFDLYNDFFQQGATYVLGLFELLRRFLQMILDLEKLSLMKKLPTLGQIVSAISKKCNCDEKEIRDLLMIKIRNMVAHDNWYVEKNNFCYEENKIIKKLSIEEFVQLIVNVTDLTNAIAIQWGQYVPTLEFERMKGKSSNYNSS